MAKEIRERGCEVILTGPHTTFFAKQILKENPWLSGILRGEYEEGVIHTIQYYLGERKREEINGFVYLEEGKFKKNSFHYLEDLDNLPFLAYHLTPCLDKYKEPLFTRLPLRMMLTSRGCPYRCNFCLYPDLMWGHKFRAQSPSRILEEIKWILKNFGAKEIYFDDDNFTLDKERVYRFCELLIKEELPIVWSCMTRADLVDEDLLKIMKRSGCVTIKFGVESASQEVLNSCGKNLSLQKIKETFKICKKLGIKIHATFLLGIPGETLESMRKTLSLAKELDPYTAQFALITPYPGTKLYKTAKEKGWLLNEDYSKFDGNNILLSPGSYTPEELKKVYEERLCFYIRPRYLLRQFIRAGSPEKFLYLVKSYLPHIKKVFSSSLWH